MRRNPRDLWKIFEHINTRECLNHPTFLGISKSILVQFLSLDTLNIESELDLVTACIRLAEAKGKENSYFMDVAIPHLRLLTLRVGNLDEIRNYLSPEEAMARIK
ncbi:Hypothetical predicted protein [Cloeon dipterum]|uniref:BACK domain-containing protein n=1 Tax=Cloeon dipterum TaxID=197152 RepID=A0A8S1BU24_9INSE|nr:Hypothetical predicted protein [Cloeon dipterum]